MLKFFLRLSLLALLALPVAAMGQAACEPGQVLTARQGFNNLASVVPGATIFVSPGPIYTDQTAGTTIAGNSVTADQNGNYTVCAPTGTTQTLSISGPNMTAVQFNQTFPSGLTFTGANIFINAGSFSDTQTFEYFQSVVGAISQNEFFIGQNAFGTEAMAGYIGIPATGSTHQADGLGGFCNSFAPSSPLGGHNNCVGVYAQATTKANNTAIWGMNTDMRELGFTGTLVIGNEIDMNEQGGSPTRWQALLITGLPFTGVMPPAPPVGNNTPATEAEVIKWVTPSGTPWPAGIVSGKGSVNGPAFQIDGLCYVGPCFSQSITFTGYDGGNVAHTSTIQDDTQGNLFLQTNSGGAIKMSVRAFATLPSCAINEGAMMGVNDSTTAVWGATITGGGANHVFAYCDGTNWTVMGK